MSRLRDVERRRRALGEIREIMSSMKSLAYTETRKLGRHVEAQRAVASGIAAAARDFLSFYPLPEPDIEPQASAEIVIGTERGFCGDFNQKLVRELLEQPRAEGTLVVAVGHKLRSLLEPQFEVAAFIDGAGATEEVASVVTRIVDELDALQQQHGALSLSGLYHGGKDGVVSRQLLPPFAEIRDVEQRSGIPPALNLEPAELLVQLVDHYLFASLHELLYTSLQSENEQRVTHLGDAVKHLDEKSASLTRTLNALRQEAIVEEIEVILLNATSVIDERHR